MGRKSVIAIAAVVAVVAAGVALLVAGVGTATADEVRFQNVSEPGPAPFTPPADVATATASSASASSEATSSGSASESSTTESTETTESSQSQAADPSAAGGADSSSDGEPKQGTFGGTGKDTVCDREKLISELSQDPDRLSAWAEVAGVDATEEAVGEYIRGLTPSTLTEDTQVTNHSFVGGQAKPYQAILAKGTAVLVDEDGTPVARCRCGNPLTEPVQLEAETKCYQCPANYTPPPPCEGRCHEPDPDPPPVTGTGGGGQVTPPPPPDATKDAIQAYKDCRKGKPNIGGVEACKTEYEAARQACDKDVLNPGCDGSICLDRLPPSAFTTACASYLENIETGLEAACAGQQTPAAKAACIDQERDKRIRCGQAPDPSTCNINPNAKFPELRKLCVSNPNRKECGALQIGCAKDASQAGCKELATTCSTQPNRPDCKVVTDFKAACSKDPNKPECKADQKKAAPTLRPEEETTEEPGAEETQDPGTGEGETTDPGTGGDTGGEAPSTETPTEPAPAPAPEGQ